MFKEAIEADRCANYISASQDEIAFADWQGNCPQDISIVTTQGFEERSVGFIEAFAASGLRADTVVIGKHSRHEDANAKYQGRFDKSASIIRRTDCHSVPVDKDGHWVATAMAKVRSPNVVLDITGIGTRGLFGALDAAVRARKSVTLAYTEASQYWPKKSDWEALKAELTDLSALPDIVNEKPWLFGYEHKVELIPGHDGYDSAGTERALIAFLPFKCARLAAVMSSEDYSAFLFIAGRPRLPENLWRYDALREINRGIVKDRPVIEMSTFGYRSALGQLGTHLMKADPILEKYDVHLALMGSKLQDVACWIFSSLLPSITVLTAVPSKYFPEAFSDGIGEKWIFPLTSPYEIT